MRTLYRKGLFLLLLLLHGTCVFASDFPQYALEVVDNLGTKIYDLESDVNSLYYLSALHKNELRIVRNSIYAKHGFVFKNKELSQFFKNRQWYKPVSDNVQLTDTDKKNIEFILQLESREEPSFQQFLQLFESKKLPLIVDNDRYQEFFDRKIETISQRNYFKRISRDYYALDKIQYHDKFIILIYINKYPAGGYFDLVYAATFSKEGNLIDEEEIGRFAGELSSHIISKTVINENYEISIEKTYIEETDSEEGLKKTVTKSNLTYHISSDGLFSEIKNEHINKTDK